MATFVKTTALAVLLGIFIFFVLIFFMIVGCTLCLLWLRKNEEDQQVLVNPGLTSRDLDDEQVHRRRHKRNHNDDVFEMEVLSCNEGKDVIADFPAQFV